MLTKTTTIAVGLALLTAACGDSGADTISASSTTAAASTSTSAQVTTTAAPESVVQVSDKPEIVTPGGEPPADLTINDRIVGDGDEATAGTLVRVHYVGVRYSDGGQFDASWDRGQPFEFELGAGRVIAGWDQGVAGMRVGGRRELIIPSDLGYGERGAGTDIPPGEALIFVVDLLEVVPAFPVPSAISDGTIVISNQGGNFEGHAPFNTDGSGPGLFAGDNLSPDFPNDDGLEILLAFSLDNIDEIDTGRAIVRAELTSRTMQVAGTPFEDLGALLASAVDYDSFPPPDDQRSPIGDSVPCDANVDGQFITCDVTDAAIAAVEAGRDRLNLSLRFEEITDGDGEADLVVFFFTDPNVNERGIFLLEIEFGDQSR